METLNTVELLYCHICSDDLQPHPLYKNTVAMTCVKHGDFFVYRERGKDPQIVFRAFQKDIKTVEREPQETAKLAKTRINPVGRTGYTVRCDQTGITFKSLTEAAWLLGINQSDLSKHLQGTRLSIGGYTFTRMLDDGLGNLTPIPRPSLTKGESTRNVSIKCNQTGRVFPSIRQAAKEMNLPRGNIYTHLRGDSNRKQVGGYTFSKVVSQEIQGL